MSYTEQIQEVKNSDLSPEEKKKAIKKIRRQIRKATTTQPKAVVVQSVDTEEKLEALLKEMKDQNLQQGDPKSSHYYFSVSHMAKDSLDFSSIKVKFSSRFSRQPETYVIHRQGRAVMLGLGPIPQV